MVMTINCSQQLNHLITNFHSHQTTKAAITQGSKALTTIREITNIAPEIAKRFASAFDSSVMYCQRGTKAIQIGFPIWLNLPHSYAP